MLVQEAWSLQVTDLMQSNEITFPVSALRWWDGEWCELVLFKRIELNQVLQIYEALYKERPFTIIWLFKFQFSSVLGTITNPSSTVQ